MLKTICIFLTAAVMTLGFISLSQADAKLKIAIIRMNNRTTYLEGQEGVISGFKKAGFDDARVEFKIRNAEDSSDKLAEIAKDLKEKKVDLIVTIGTDVTVAIAREIQDIPIVFSQVGDPITAGIVKSLENSGNNLTGTLTETDPSIPIEIFKKIIPIKRLGVLYSGQDVQSVTRLDFIRETQGKHGFKVVPADLKAPEEAEVTVSSLAGRIDGLYVGSGNTIGKAIDSIAETAIKFKIPTIGNSIDKAEKGILLCVTAGRFKLGELAAQKAIEILNGKKPSDIPIESLKNLDIMLNPKTAKAIGVTIPESFLKIVTRTIE